jgi:uncharacterized membrane protein (UPF0127 family)
MSNKTPKAGDAKTAWALKIAFYSAFTLLVVLLIFITVEKRSVITTQKPKPDSFTTCLRLPLDEGRCTTLAQANTNEAQLRGLSGLDTMPMGTTGMIFNFPESNGQCFWMKEMKFAIDMVFVDADKKIIKIEKNVAPETYPNSFCADNVRHVIELEAGASDLAGLSAGQQLDF